MPARLLMIAVIALGALMPGIAVAQDRQVPRSEQQIKLSYAPVVREAAPAVVNVYATTVTRQSASPFANDPFFRRFFGEDNPMFRSRPRESHSLGSGVIVDPGGYILTNSHVVSGATDIRVSTTRGRQYDVELVLDDQKTDLAVLRITGADREFPYLEFGDSDDLAVGDLVLAIGDPFGVGQTVTSGIVSALARTGVETSDYGFFIQTDAAINPGNSGGALVDMNGNLVGINSSIFTRSGGNLGIGFAIPADMARVVAEAGIAGTEVVRPWMGVALQEVTPDLADSVGIDPPRGALVTEVAANSPAANAGLQSGDVIMSVAGHAVDSPNAFNYRIATQQVGGTAEIGFIRDGQERTVTARLSAGPDNVPDQQVQISGNTRFAGVTAEAMTPQLAQEYGLPFDTGGIIIVSVAEGSPAARMGLQQGDIIRSLNGEEMTDLERFGNLASQRRDGWQIVLQRGNQVIRSYVSG